MKAVDFINEHIDPKRLLDYYHFRQITDNGDSIRSCCEIHKGDNPTAFMWNKSNNLWYCYTGSCHGGDAYTLVEKMEGVDFPTAVKRVAAILGLNITGMKIEQQTDIVLVNTLKWLQYMKSKEKTKTLQPYELPYTKYKNYSEVCCYHVVSRFETECYQFYNVQFATTYPTEDSLLHNKIVIPIYFKDILCGVALRDMTGKYQPKWLYQPEGLPIRNILYNYDVALKTIRDNKINELILVEGVYDVWAFHCIGIDNVVAIFGSALKDGQFKLLLQTGVDITTCFDHDDAGLKCTEQVLKKFRNKSELKVIDLPKDTDPADCTPETLRQSYLTRRIYP